MKFRVARESNGLIGLYWLGQGVNHIALNFTRSELGDNELVIAMCDRLHPGWYEEDEE